MSWLLQTTLATARGTVPISSAKIFSGGAKIEY
jgi:hypothetical protein